ncbi:hypothetical protein KGF56_000612 [Candida oxycetoniae]|uniref:Uncharacterized protein n=1 Tax=Candida oxycetoniae TaxID=497107 RepID=A0AAI9T1T0_9ASCO|nr:uncharacterized protein KGF56_000612 [Candida oxycetoniae]KAI3406480.1 hypothetical protein KGF56_000612 [Candida oxycetoniae]
MNLSMDGEGKLTLSRKEFKILYNNILQNLIHRLSLRIPSTDPRMDIVARDLENYLSQTFQGLIQSLIIDGEDLSSTSILEVLKVDSHDDNVEPFDLATNNKLRQILIRNDELVLEISKLKRSLSLRAQDIYQEFTRSVDDQVSRIVAKIDLEVEQEQKRENEQDYTDITQFKFDEINKPYEDYLGFVNSLKNNLPLLQSEFERYDNTIDFLEKAHEEQMKQKD